MKYNLFLVIVAFLCCCVLYLGSYIHWLWKWRRNPNAVPVFWDRILGAAVIFEAVNCLTYWSFVEFASWFIIFYLLVPVVYGTISVMK